MKNITIDITPEQKENAVEWIAALRSGDYKQGQKRLYKPKENSYCCMGVACEVSGLEKSADKTAFVFNRVYYNTTVPDSEWFENQYGFIFQKPLLDDGFGRKVSEAHLYYLNDCHGWSFAQIADLLEAVLVTGETKEFALTPND